MICFRNQLVDPTVQRNLVFAALWSISWCFDPKTKNKGRRLDICMIIYVYIYIIYIYVLLFYRYIYMIIDMSICLVNMFGMFFLYVFSHFLFFFSGFLVPVQDMMMCSLGARDVFTSQAVDILTLTWPLADGQWFRCIELGEVKPWMAVIVARGSFVFNVMRRFLYWNICVWYSTLF